MTTPANLTVSRSGSGTYSVALPDGTVYALDHLGSSHWELSREGETWAFRSKKAAIAALASGRIRPGAKELAPIHLRAAEIHAGHIGRDIRFPTEVQHGISVTVEAELRQVYHISGSTTLNVLPATLGATGFVELSEFGVDPDAIVEMIEVE